MQLHRFISPLNAEAEQRRALIENMNDYTKQTHRVTSSALVRLFFYLHIPRRVSPELIRLKL